MTTVSFPPGSSPPDTTHRTGAYLRLCGLGCQDSDGLAGRPVDQIQDELETWAESLTPARAGECRLQQRSRAKAQLLLAEVPARWPAHFLRDPAPPEIAAAVQACTLVPTRPLRQTSMSPRPIDLGPVSEVAQGTWKTFDTWPVLRGLTTWMLFALLLGAVFYVVRF
jgi:hypothetical protein